MIKELNFLVGVDGWFTSNYGGEDINGSAVPLNFISGDFTNSTNASGSIYIGSGWSGHLTNVNNGEILQLRNMIHI